MSIASHPAVPLAVSKKEGALTGFDTAWYNMDHPKNLMVVNSLTFLSRAPAKEIINERLLDNFMYYGDGRLRCFIRAKDEVGRPDYIESKEIELSYHLQIQELKRGTQAEVEERVGELLGQPLDPGRPMWRFHLFTGYKNITQDGAQNGEITPGAVLLARIHHAYADGISHIYLLTSLFDDYKAVSPADDATLDTGANTEMVAKVAKGFERMTPNPPGFFPGEPGGQKRVTWLPSIGVDELKAIGRPFQATINDILMSVLAGALRARLTAQGVDVPTDLRLRMSTPASVREGDARGNLGNQFGLLTLTLPVGLKNPADRISHIKRFMGKLRKGSLLPDFFKFLVALGYESPRRQDEIWSALHNKYTGVTSNIPGIREEHTIGGAKILEMLFFPPPNNPIGISAGFLSYNGRLKISLATDTQILNDPTLLAKEIAKEIEIHRELKV